MFEIREDLIVALVNYLGKRPYNEVYGLIEGIKQVKKIEPKEEVREVTPETTPEEIAEAIIKEEACKDTATSAKKK
jgi:SHS2 domain-containing protein